MRKRGTTGEATGKNDVKNIAVRSRMQAARFVALLKRADEGEIKVSTLKGELGYINKSEHEVACLLEPETKNGVFAKFDCDGITSVVGVPRRSKARRYYGTKGGGTTRIISPITPVNQMSTSFTQVYTVNEDIRKHTRQIRRQATGGA